MIRLRAKIFKFMFAPLDCGLPGFMLINNSIRLRWNNADMARSYEQVIQLLNSLQSRIIVETEKLTNPQKTEKYLTRAGIKIEDINRLSVIHIGGTKGKGSTCSLCEAVIRQHGYKTGLFTSPHLVSVRERIKINGINITENIFMDNFQQIYGLLNENKENDKDMPGYFKFLTILAFKIFLSEKVNVCVIEVGVGGEYDSTNFLTRPDIVGITSIGIDHTDSLGHTVGEISWHKAGIMKPGAQCFTIPQTPISMEVLMKRATSRNCDLNIVQDLDKYNWESECNKLDDIRKLNASLAIQMSYAWLRMHGNKFESNTITKTVFEAITQCPLPARMQVITKDAVTYLVDGAHTYESILQCTKWFKEQSKLDQKYVLIVNVTPGHDYHQIFKVLIPLNFHYIIFTTNFVDEKGRLEIQNLSRSFDYFCENTQTYQNAWAEMSKNTHEELYVVRYVKDALEIVSKLCDNDKHQYLVLVTGSFHLVGSVLSILDPELKLPVLHHV